MEYNINSVRSFQKRDKSTGIVSAISKIEAIVGRDPGKRGVQHLRIPSSLLDICRSLHETLLIHQSKRLNPGNQSGSKSKEGPLSDPGFPVVGILVGFPCLEGPIPEENDGIAGTVYLIRALQAAGFEVEVLVDSWSSSAMECFRECHVAGFTHRPVQIRRVSPLEVSNDVRNFGSDAPLDAYSHLISIECASPAIDGQFYTMRGRDMTPKLSGGLASLYMRANTTPEVTTVGIGDGGNELGMGKVRRKVVDHIPEGELIGSDVSCDHLLACGVSNWGGFAVAAGLFLLRREESRKGTIKQEEETGQVISQEPDWQEFLLDEEAGERLMRWVGEMGFRDGVTGETGMTVDGMEYEEVHLPIAREIMYNILYCGN